MSPRVAGRTGWCPASMTHPLAFFDPRPALQIIVLSNKNLVNVWPAHQIFPSISSYQNYFKNTNLNIIPHKWTSGFWPAHQIFPNISSFQNNFENTNLIWKYKFEYQSLQVDEWFLTCPPNCSHYIIISRYVSSPFSCCSVTNIYLVFLSLNDSFSDQKFSQTNIW